jgi:hypothetical protein
MVIEVKEKLANGEKNCEWLIFDNGTGEIERLHFKGMSQNKREFHGDITLEWDKQRAIMVRNDNKEDFEVKFAK